MRSSPLNRERDPERIVHAEGVGALRLSSRVTPTTCRARKKMKIFGAPGGVRRRQPLLHRGGLEGAPPRSGPRGLRAQGLLGGRHWETSWGTTRRSFFLRGGIKSPTSPIAEVRPVHQPAGAGEHLGLLLGTAEREPVRLALRRRGSPQSYRHMDGFGSTPSLGETRAAKKAARGLLESPLQDRQGHTADLKSEEAGKARRPRTGAVHKDLYDSSRSRGDGDRRGRSRCR